MRLPYSILVFLLGLSLVAVSCVPTRGRSSGDDDDDNEGDDDDNVGDDDDVVGDDDDVVGDDDDATPPDDDDVGDDDDNVDDDDASTFSYDALTFGATLSVITAARDDVFVVDATYSLTYWYDQAAGVEECRQLISMEGEAVFGYDPVGDGSCTTCTGVIIFDPTTVVDISDPYTDPDHCDTAVLDAEGVNIGDAMTLEPPNGGGDFLSMALINQYSWGVLGNSADLGGSTTASSLESDLAGAGLALEHVGLVNNLPDSMSAQVGLDGVATAADNGTSTWNFFWYIYRDPTGNPYEGDELQGDYYVGSFWQLGGGSK